MKQLLVFSMLLTVVGACDDSPSEPELFPLEMSQGNLELQWAVVAAQEQACGGGRVAGGYMTGQANFTQLGLSSITMSAAWDIDRLIDPPQFTPTSPAVGGPVATVLQGDEYPYAFHFAPAAQQCGNTVEATGEIVLTAANGDKVFGAVSGGETFRLDFQNPGDGIENFTIITVEGGTGRYENATGSFTAHTITRFDYTSSHFVMDLAEVLPGGTISY